jgi:hypothetical protein
MPKQLLPLKRFTTQRQINFKNNMRTNPGKKTQAFNKRHSDSKCEFTKINDHL